MKAVKLKKLCEYISSFDEEDQEFEISVSAFGQMFVLDYYQELDISTMEELGCEYDSEYNGFVVLED